MDQLEKELDEAQTMALRKRLRSRYGDGGGSQLMDEMASDFELRKKEELAQQQTKIERLVRGQYRSTKSDRCLR